jgi:aminoglycoside 6'-N-acetyltransferase
MKDVIAAEADLVIRRMRDHPDDYALIVAWRNNPHVREWWDPDEPATTMAGVIDQLEALTSGHDPTTPCIIEVAGTPAGYLEFYPWEAEAEYLAEIALSLPEGSWGLDIFIGESGLINQGIGSRTVRLISDTLFAEREATAVALIMEAGNDRAQAAYARAGMRVSGAPFLDTDLRDGRRVASILMIRDRPGGTAAGR